MRHNICFHEWEITPYSFKNKSVRCPKCTIKEFNKDLAKTTDSFKKEVYNLVGDEYTVLGEYKNKNTKLLMKHNCEKCNNYEYNVTPNVFLSGSRCPKCNILCKDSKGERELREFVESLTECYDKSFSSNILDGKEIDILTKNNIGFEYNGEYWHQEGVNVEIGYHKNKTLKAKEKGIILYHIWEKEWLYRKDEVKNFIRKVLI